MANVITKCRYFQLSCFDAATVSRYYLSVYYILPIIMSGYVDVKLPSVSTRGFTTWKVHILINHKSCNHKSSHETIVYVHGSNFRHGRNNGVYSDLIRLKMGS